MGRVGPVLMMLGMLLLMAAATISAGNQSEDRRAGAESARLLASLEAAPPEETAEDSESGCFGCLTIPRLELELPVLTEWSYDNLKIAPCRYSGSIRGADLVLIAHNYRAHFGPIRRLKPGDQVSLSDMNGAVFEYRVTGTEVVSPAALEAVASGSHALTLITCTYGGKTRLVVYCDAAKT